MNKEWVLHVENFAKIESADVRITPLMCFVGDNNSGKSYLMSLLWGILTLGKDIFPKSPSDSKIYRKCENWLKANKNKNVEVTEDIAEIYVQWFNELLNIHKKDLLHKIFNYEVEAEKISISGYSRKKRLDVQWENTGERYSVTEKYIRFPLQEAYSREQLLRMNAYIC